MKGVLQTLTAPFDLSEHYIPAFASVKTHTPQQVLRGRWHGELSVAQQKRLSIFIPAATPVHTSTHEALKGSVLQPK